MKRFWILIPLFGLLTGCIDDQYRLNRLDNEGRLFKNLEIPVGNTRLITLEDLLGKDPGTIPLREDGTYLVQMTAGIEDVNLSLSDLVFEDAELGFSVTSTIPLDISMNAEVLDTEGVPFATNPIQIESDQNIEIPAGSKASPSESRIRIRIHVGKDRQIGTIRFLMEGKTPPGAKSQQLTKDQGIRLSDIYLRIPSGIRISD